MAYEKGTASNHFDLMLKLETFLTSNADLVAKGQQWEVLRSNTANPYSNDTITEEGFCLHRFFMGKGLDKKDSIIVPMAVYQYPEKDTYSLAMYTARSYTSDKKVSEQFTDNTLGSMVCAMPIWNNSIPYWFIASGRRFIVVAKIANRYSSLYCGFILPSGTDLEYPYPLFIGGNTGLYDIPYSTTSSNTARSFFNPQKGRDSYSRGNSSSYLFDPVGSIIPLDNIGGEYFSSIEREGSTYPYNLNYRYNFQIKTFDNQYVLRPIDIVQNTPNPQHLGWFDGVYFVSGFENSPENIITVDNVQYLCIHGLIQNEYNNWAAIRLD